MKSKKQTPEMSFIKKMLALKRAGIDISPETKINTSSEQELLPLNERIVKVLGIIEKPVKSTDMLYWIMYDIENNKVRNQIAKYLIKKGCVRVQKSIFLAKTERAKFDEIYRTLKEVNELYQNYDSIILIPISTDEIKAMKLVGSNIDFSLFVKKPNTLFF